MGMLPSTPKDYTKDGKTKQSFKDETDINKIMVRAQKTGTISHISQYGPLYGDFSDFDFFEAQLNLTKGREIFDALPSELRTEFEQSPAKFFAYVNDPANAGKLKEKLPQLAQPGKQLIDVSGKSAPADASEPQASETQPAAPQPAPAAENPAEGP